MRLKSREGEGGWEGGREGEREGGLTRVAAPLDQAGPAARGGPDRQMQLHVLQRTSQGDRTGLLPIDHELDGLG
jgi:hypothetical protein